MTDSSGTSWGGFVTITRWECRGGGAQSPTATLARFAPALGLWIAAVASGPAAVADDPRGGAGSTADYTANRVADPTTPRPGVAGSKTGIAGLEIGGRAVTDRASRGDAVAALPMDRLIESARQEVESIVDKPTLYRRLPVQQIQTDQDMFVFLTRHPEVLVGMWDLMGITNVQIRRTGPYTLAAQDGSGTTCQIDLVYGDTHLHLFVARGVYDGKLVARPVRGSGVFLIRSQPGPSGSMIGVLDCFLQLQNLGADLLVRTFGGLIGRSADHNFQETANFVQQVSIASQTNPAAMLDVARRLPQTTPPVQDEFARQVRRVAIRR